MTGQIRVLPDSVARKIAAGEVIERPMSVVKELVENSLDAAARHVVVELEQGGRGRIAVTDDGEGMPREEVAMAFEPHATSKIRTDDDLLRIATLGFRGEALPSIAAVSDIELWTCRRGETGGSHLRLRGGQLVLREDAGTAVGARLEVRDLFFNTPARRKFLKAPATEAGHVAQLISRLALARPEVGFALRQDGRDSLSLPPDTRRARVRRILGAEIAGHLRPVEHDGAVRVSGFVSHPHFSAANARNILFFVNGRWVRDRLLQHALLAAYATLIPHGRQPAAVLFFDVAPDAVDVNVHPTKLEVRFRDSQAVHEAVSRAVREAIRGSMAISSARPEPPRIAEATPLYGAGSPGDNAERLGSLRLVAMESAPAAVLPFAADGMFASLRIVGQVFDGYLVCEGDGEIVLIDQHAAHERVAFERILAARGVGRVETQVMLVPQPVEVGTGDGELLSAAAEDLASCGLELEPFGERAVLVRSVPALLPVGSIVPLVQAIAADLAQSECSRTLEARTDGLLATIACHSVVRVGQRLSETEMRALLAAMDSIDRNASCPHGRPVARRIARSELERRFGR